MTRDKFYLVYEGMGIVHLWGVATNHPRDFRVLGQWQRGGAERQLSLSLDFGLQGAAKREDGEAY